MGFFKFSFSRLLAVVIALSILGAGIGLLVQDQLMARQCEARLRGLYTALEQYEIDRGLLPHLALFPDDPKQDSNSLLAALASYIASPELYICPATPQICRDTGLSYIWNVKLNGRKLREDREPLWMLTEINALSQEVPAPHGRCYHILYTDGTIRHSKQPPPGL